MKDNGDKLCGDGERMGKAMMNTMKILVVELEKSMILRPPRADQVDLHAICACVCACNKDSIADFGS